MAVSEAELAVPAGLCVALHGPQRRALRWMCAVEDAVAASAPATHPYSTAMPARCLRAPLFYDLETRVPT